MQRLSEKAQRDLDEMKKQLSSVQTEASLAAERVNQLEKDAREKASIHAQFMAKVNAYTVHTYTQYRETCI